MTKKVAILQSCYIPWKGYFDLINMVDEFIIYDDMQYTKRDWRNRNLLKTTQGLRWLTIPVCVKGKYLQKINETEIDSTTWHADHWKTITSHYSKAKYYAEYKSFFEELYSSCFGEKLLSRVNYHFLRAICDLLNIKTTLTWSTDYCVQDDLRKSDRLLALCQQANATHYISGPSANNYLDIDLFNAQNMTVSYIDYSNYPTYPQLFNEFEHGVSIVDLILNVGADARKYLKSCLDAELLIKETA